MADQPIRRSGFVALIGAPNAGKSTLLNRILKVKVAIVAPKPQTTRHRILGVHTGTGYQAVFWDTPGIHQARGLLNQTLMARAGTALREADVALWVVEAGNQGRQHLEAAAMLAERPAEQPLLIALNKVDLLPQGQAPAALEHLKASLSETCRPLAMNAVSALTGLGLKKLLSRLGKALPPGPRLYPEEFFTDQPERLIAAEMIREAVFRLTGQEVPYGTAVTMDEFREEPDILRLAATIHVERDSQKGIIIGRQGLKLKEIGQSARQEIERMTGSPVFLQLFVRVTKNWTKNIRALDEFGYRD